MGGGEGGGGGGRGGGGGGRGTGGNRPGRKDYSLLREGQAPEDIFDAEAQPGKAKRSANAWRLLKLAKEETLVQPTHAGLGPGRSAFRGTLLLSVVHFQAWLLGEFFVLTGLASAAYLLQVLVLATIALFIGSLSTVAVPKLAGNLIDICVEGQKEGGRAQADNQLLSMCAGSLWMHA